MFVNASYFIALSLFVYNHLRNLWYHVKHTTLKMPFQNCKLKNNYIIFGLTILVWFRWKLTQLNHILLLHPSHMTYDLSCLLSWSSKTIIKHSKLLEWVAVVATQDKWHLRWKDEFVSDTLRTGLLINHCYRKYLSLFQFEYLENKYGVGFFIQNNNLYNH